MPLAATQVIDIIGFGLAVLGAYSAFRYLRYSLPRNFITLAARLLNEMETLLNSAEAVGAIPSASEYRMSFEILRNQFLRLRTISHRSPSFLQQLQLAFLSTLTYRVYVLYSQIGAMRLEVERVMDEHELALAPAVQTATTTALPGPAGITVTPAADVAEPTPPLPVVVSEASQA